jgi:hypothetical protein
VRAGVRALLSAAQKTAAGLARMQHDDCRASCWLLPCCCADPLLRCAPHRTWASPCSTEPGRSSSQHVCWRAVALLQQTSGPWRGAWSMGVVVGRVLQQQRVVQAAAAA